jgi:hypothetical protein
MRIGQEPGADSDWASAATALDGYAAADRQAIFVRAEVARRDQSTTGMSRMESTPPARARVA